jgi:uncharacterized protein YeaO (DUF488 family)
VTVTRRPDRRGTKQPRASRRRPGSARGAGGRLAIKRAYEPVARSDGYRVLIDRLWPRGMRKEALALGAWMRDLAPSDALRRWFGHDPRRWTTFVARYREELRAPAARAALAELAARAAAGPVTLVYGAADVAHNDAVVLREKIARILRARGRGRARVRDRTRNGA